jgi:hypothetical protein
MGWKEAIYTYPSSIVYEIHDLNHHVFCHIILFQCHLIEFDFRNKNDNRQGGPKSWNLNYNYCKDYSYKIDSYFILLFTRAVLSFTFCVGSVGS